MEDPKLQEQLVLIQGKIQLKSQGVPQPSTIGSLSHTTTLPNQLQIFSILQMTHPQLNLQRTSAIVKRFKVKEFIQNRLLMMISLQSSHLIPERNLTRNQLKKRIFQ